MAGGLPNTATIDLGEDLTCAICMQILFQPLTLLDCMHTFCGACSKDWFAHQASGARTAHPYTCPSCRDPVRSTKRYPFIMNMLEKHLNKNPEKARSEEDKQEHMDKYKPGDNVLPKLRLRGPAPDPEDQQVLNDVMQLSLQEAGITENTLQPPETRRRGGSSGSRSRHSSRSPGAAAREAPQPTDQSTSTTAASTVAQVSDHTRHITHQSSLISMLSVSEMDPSDMQEEITRMIAEEGLLDDVDLSNLDSTREDELSERIAAAYRRRKEEARRRRQQTDGDNGRDSTRRRDRSTQRTSNSRASSRSGIEESSRRSTDRRRTEARPPVSNPQLMDSANQGQRRLTRTSSSGSAVSAARTDNVIATSLPSLTPLLPLAQPADERRRRSTERSSTDPNRAVATTRPSAGPNPGSAPSTPRAADSFLVPSRMHARQRSDSNPQRSPRLGSSSTFPRTGANRSTSSLPIGPGNGLSEPLLPSANLSSTQVGASSSAPSSTRSRPTLYLEPSISCRKCRKEHIEYDIHYNCPQCSGESEQYNICKPCFRKREGPLHQPRSEPIATGGPESQNHQIPSISQDKPHVFTAERLSRPRHPLQSSPRPANSHGHHAQLRSEEDPAKRLERGAFCDLCQAFANNCYWKCDACNDGEWGYCNNCVMQGKHCAHPLQPLKAIEELDQASTMSHSDRHLAAPNRPEAEQLPLPPSTPKSASVIDGPTVLPVANLPFKPLTFHTLCDICTTPIAPSVTRYHCPQCNGGDYDICMSCYHGLVSTGKISHANGPQGWRKCPEGHRMVVIGFQDSGGGSRRVVDRDIVGGWTLVDDQATASSTTARKWRWKGDDGQEQAVDPEYRNRTHSHSIRLPPDGGIGLIFYSKWNYFPDDATEKDLCFPKGAEIRESQDINGEWLWGYYAGKTGLFPAAYVDFLRKVAM